MEFKIGDGMIKCFLSLSLLYNYKDTNIYRPDLTYFERVKDEFKQKGITVDDIEEKYKFKPRPNR